MRCGIVRSSQNANDPVFELQLDSDSQKHLGSPTWFCNYFGLTTTRASYSMLAEFIRERPDSGLHSLLFRAAAGRKPERVEIIKEDGGFINPQMVDYSVNRIQLLPRTDLGSDKKLKPIYDELFTMITEQVERDRRSNTTGLKEIGFYVTQLVKSDDPRVESLIDKLSHICEMPFYDVQHGWLQDYRD